MNRNFLFTCLAGAVALGVFAYFIFGFASGPMTTPASGTSTADIPTPAPAKTTTDKVKIEELQEGTGPAVKSGDTVVIDYTGTLTDGTTFDSSIDRGQPFETKIGVGQVIKGWDEGVVGMKVGGKRKLTIPPSLGYGDQANGKIPANSTLIFEVELKGIK